MDYSLLIGINKSKNEIICGIIDYLEIYKGKRLEIYKWKRVEIIMVMI